MESQQKGAVIALSGGMDSAILLHWVLNTFGPGKVYTLGFDYGQRHSIELDQAAKIASFFGVHFEVLQVPKIFAGANSYLTNPDIVVEDFMDQSYDDLQARQGAQPSVVPGRNLIFLALSASYAEAHEVPTIYLGNHAGDAHHHHYPDCTPEFSKAAASAIEVGSGGLVDVQTPFVTLTKGQVAKIGLEAGTPLYLTQSCYQGMRPACGRCATCLERLGAFKEIGAKDSIRYQYVPEEFRDYVEVLPPAKQANFGRTPGRTLFTQAQSSVAQQGRNLSPDELQSLRERSERLFPPEAPPDPTAFHSGSELEETTQGDA